MAYWQLILYRCLIVLLLPIALVRLYWRTRHYPDARKRWKERLGRFSPTGKARPCIVLHAVSVGEANAAEPLINSLLETYPKHTLVVTTTTLTGAATVVSRHGESVVHAFYPYDLGIFVRRFLTAVNPVLVILMETELWPNFIFECHERQIPTMLINGRLSEKALRRYLLAADVARDMLHKITAIAAQSSADAQRFIALGAEPDKVTAVGSLKFEREINHSLLERGEAIRRHLGSSRFVIMAGSTRDGEEELILNAFFDVKQRLDNAFLIIAPRHPERFDSVAELLLKSGLAFCRHQAVHNISEVTDVLLLDVMGELQAYYAASDVAFVGGSLLPFGGHNTLEPAGLGVPIIVGPHTYNFTDINQKLSAAGALLAVDDAPAFGDAVLALNSDSNRRDAMGQAGREVFERNRGALSQIEAIIDQAMVG